MVVQKTIKIFKINFNHLYQQKVLFVEIINKINLKIVTIIVKKKVLITKINFLFMKITLLI